jgi:uncharacterized SAM-binding protein YcdF (DUF218 family)
LCDGLRPDLSSGHTSEVSELAAPATPGALPRRRWIAPALGLLLVLGLVIGIGGDRLYVSPAVSRLAPGERVDAVVALGGKVESATYAQRLVEAGVAPVLVLSDPYSPDDALPVHRACAASSTRYQVFCFAPDPATTRGEAQQIQALAAVHGWTRIVVVAPTFHISRARVLVRRCFSGTLLMLPPPLKVAWDSWTYQYARQSAGYVKVALHRSC